MLKRLFRRESKPKLATSLAIAPPSQPAMKERLIMQPIYTDTLNRVAVRFYATPPGISSTNAFIRLQDLCVSVGLGESSLSEIDRGITAKYSTHRVVVVENGEMFTLVDASIASQYVDKFLSEAPKVAANACIRAVSAMMRDANKATAVARAA